MPTTPDSTGRLRKGRRALAASLASVVLLATACGASEAQAPAPQDPDVPAAADLEVVGADLVAALDDAGLTSISSAVAEVDVDQILGDGQFTFLAPSDEAFLAATADELADVLADPDALLALLQNHVLPERLDADALADVSEVRTQAGERLAVGQADGALELGGATVLTTNIDVGGGVVHTIDRLLLPE